MSLKMAALCLDQQPSLQPSCLNISGCGPH